MKKTMVVLGTLFMVCLSARAALVGPFKNTDALIEGAKDIVVAECVSTDLEVKNGIGVAEVSIVKALKGDRKPGKLRVATIYPMTPHTVYMLINSGGSYGVIDFLATQKLSVVPLPGTFTIEELKGKDLKEQVQYIFSRRLYEVERQLAPLLEEKKLLDTAVADRKAEWYTSDGPVVIGKVITAATDQTARPAIRMELEGEKISWSHREPGKSGYLYFGWSGLPENETPWEFAVCDANKIEDLSGKPLKAHFFGMYTPARAESPLGWQGAESIPVSVGQVILVRGADAPRTIYIVQIVSQDKDREAMTYRYAAVRDKAIPPAAPAEK